MSPWHDLLEKYRLAIGAALAMVGASFLAAGGPPSPPDMAVMALFGWVIAVQ